MGEMRHGILVYKWAVEGRFAIEMSSYHHQYSTRGILFDYIPYGGYPVSRWNKGPWNDPGYAGKSFQFQLDGEVPYTKLGAYHRV